MPIFFPVLAVDLALKPHRKEGSASDQRAKACPLIPDAHNNGLDVLPFYRILGYVFSQGAVLIVLLLVDGHVFWG